MEVAYAMLRFIQEPYATYAAYRSRFTTSHQLADFDFCPLYHKQKRHGLIAEKQDESLLIGAATHCRTLEGPDRFHADYQCGGGPINPKTDKPYGDTTKKFRDWAERQTKTILTEDQYALVMHLDHAVHSHPLASLILADGVPEGVLRDNYCGLPCQVRIDWFAAAWGIADLKTCQSLDQFEEVADREYVFQMAFYRAIVRQASGETVPVYLIAVEKQQPYRCGVWRIKPEKLRDAEAINEFSLRELAHCQRDNHWPTRYEDLRVL
jgi:hypothetical protein